MFVCVCVHAFLHVRICVCDAFICAFVRVRMLLYVLFLDCQLFVLHVALVRCVPGGRFIRSQGSVVSFCFCVCLCLRFCLCLHRAFIFFVLVFGSVSVFVSFLCVRSYICVCMFVGVCTPECYHPVRLCLHGHGMIFSSTSLSVCCRVVLARP